MEMTIVQEEDRKIAAPLVEPAAGIHHSDTYWGTNKTADNEGTRGSKREKQREEG